MCGIAGFNWADPALAGRMTEAIRHRGPDGHGLFTDARVSLGHRRLAIIDLSDRGHQPLVYKKLVIVHNGEIYNFREIRAELQTEGYSFASDADTEVIAAAFHRWGPECVSRFNGMWAFCIYDPDKRSLFLSRDRFGIKPLYYYFDGEKFVFASELKAIMVHDLPRRVSLPAVNFFFYQKYIGGGLTIFENCFKLRPGHDLTFDLTTKQLRASSYYDLAAEVAKQANRPLEQRLESVESTLSDAVERSLVADVPVGAFLSGGLDSSLISAFISRTRRAFPTFSIGFEHPSYDETPFARRVSAHLGTDHAFETMEADETVIRTVIQAMDEPFGDASIFPTYLLSGMARRKVKACLSGDGGDEVFGGYDAYLGSRLAGIVPRALVRLARPLAETWPASERKVTPGFKARRFVRDYDQPPGRRHLDWLATFTDLPRKDLLTSGFVGSTDLIPAVPGHDLLGLQLSDISLYLAEDLLKKVDLASMLHSLEVRIPFLDYRLVPLVLSLPPAYKIRGLTTKWLLKRIAEKYIPGRIARRPKRGFTVPISQWIRTNSWIREVITELRCYDHGLLNRAVVQDMLARHEAGRKDLARELWLVFVFNAWMEFAGASRS